MYLFYLNLNLSILCLQNAGTIKSDYSATKMHMCHWRQIQIKIERNINDFYLARPESNSWEQRSVERRLKKILDFRFFIFRQYTKLIKRFVKIQWKWLLFVNIIEWMSILLQIQYCVCFSFCEKYWLLDLLWRPLFETYLIRKSENNFTWKSWNIALQ